MELNFALKAHDKDNVATVFTNNVVEGNIMQVTDKRGQREEIEVLSALPYGHKIAVTTIDCGGEILKYGETIGVATKEIKKGEYVHIHNMDALRGRGDINL